MSKIKMCALQSRGAGSSPTGAALARGETYEATDQQARDDERRGFGERIAATPVKAKPAVDAAGVDKG